MDRYGCVLIDITLLSNRIVKELTVIDLSSGFTTHEVFKSPYIFNGEESYQSIYARNYIHGLSAESGSKEFCQLESILRQSVKNARFIFLKGTEKCQIVQSLLRDGSHIIIELGLFGCPKLPSLLSSTELISPCYEHSLIDTSYHQACSLVKGAALRKWINQNEHRVNLFDTIPRIATFGMAKYVNDKLQLAKNGFVRCTRLKSGLQCVYCQTVLSEFEHPTHRCM